MSNLVNPHLSVTREDIAAYCRRWRVAEMALFGSVVRQDFGPGSDIDVMVRFEPGAKRSLWDLVRMRDELTELLGHNADLVEHGQIVNPFFRRSIGRDLTPIYAA